MSLLDVFRHCFQPPTEVAPPPPKSGESAAGGAPVVLADKTVQASAPGAPRVTLRQGLVRGLKSVAAAFCCGLYRLKQPRTEEQLRNDHAEVRHQVEHGDDLMNRNEYPAALEAYQAALKIQERLVREKTGHLVERNHLVVVYSKIGDVHLCMRGAVRKTAEAYVQAWQEAFVDRMSGGGVPEHSQAHEQAALKAYQAALKIQKHLVNQDGGNLTWLNSLAELHTQIGEIHADSLIGDFHAEIPMDSRARKRIEKQMSESYQAALKTRLQLVKRDPGTPDWQYKLAEWHEKSGDMKIWVFRDRYSAVRNYKEAIQILSRPVNGPEEPRFSPLLQRCLEKLSAACAHLGLEWRTWSRS